MTDEQGRRAPRRGRARKRAIRAQAARAGVAYSVAARQLEAAGLRPGESIASQGRTVHPAAGLRDSRSAEQRRDDARRAGLIPSGRAQRLVERFPPTGGRPGSRAGPFYSGAGRTELLSLVYAQVAGRSPGLLRGVAGLPPAADEFAVDRACAALDRAAREFLEADPAELSGFVHGFTPGEPPFGGVRQILDAVLVAANDGHTPGTRVRMFVSPHENRTAAIVAAVWGACGPPVAYRVQIEGLGIFTATVPGELIVLAGQ